MQNKESEEFAKDKPNSPNLASSSDLQVAYKNGEIEMIPPPHYIDFNDINNDDDLSEFSEYKDNDFVNYDYLEETLDSTVDFDFDIIFTPENNSELLQINEIKHKIVNKIKLSFLELSYIKKMEDSDKFSLIKLFNHMV